MNSRAPSLSILSPPSLCNDGGPGAEYADYKSTAPTARTAARACRPPPPMVNLHPSAPRRAELGFRRRLRRRRPRLGFCPARADSMWARTIVSCGNKSDKCMYMTVYLKELQCLKSKVRAIHNRNDTR